MLRTLRLYLAVIRIGLSSAMEYRANYIVNTVVTVLAGAAVQMYLWYAVYESRAEGSTVVGMSLSGMLVYICCSVMCFSLTRNGSRERDAAQQIRSGGLNAYLLKPVSHGLYTFSLSVAERLSQSVFVLISGLLVLSFATHWLHVSLSMSGVLCALPILAMASVMNFLMGLGISYLAFWLDEVWTFHAIKDIALGLLSGMMFPLSALASPWREWSTLLPFQFFAYIPAALMNGSINPDAAPRLMAQAALWLLICIAMVMVIWKVGLRRYSAFGG